MLIEVNETFSEDSLELTDIMDAVKNWYELVLEGKISKKTADCLFHIFYYPTYSIKGDFQNGFTYYGIWDESESDHYSPDDDVNGMTYTLFTDLEKAGFIGKIKDDVYLLSAFGDAQFTADERAEEYPYREGSDC